MPIAGESEDPENLSPGGLVSLVRQLLGRVETLEKGNALLKEDNTALMAENVLWRERLRAAQRSAAPFSKCPGPGNPKRPGRRQGKGRFERRTEPVPGPTDRVEELRAPLDSPDRPQRGARLEVMERVATVEGTPPEPVRIILRFHVKHGACAVRGWSGRGRHADPAPGRHAATAHRTGSRLMARAVTLHCHFGLPLCKVPGVIRAAAGSTGTGIRRS